MIINFSVIPSYITLDTVSLVNLFITKNLNDYYSDIKGKQKKIWDKFFHINKRVFKKNGYNFNYMIKTDGVSCSILFVKLDKNNKPIKKPSFATLNKLHDMKEKADKNYIEEQPNVKEILRNKNYVCIDPNASDLMYCMDKYEEKFRYTQNQRRKETKNKKYNKIIETINKETEINNESIKQIESKLSKYNCKTCDLHDFFKYLKCKNKINKILCEQYQEEVYRKLKWYIYINTQKSESKMVKNFENKFGPPEETIIIFGDYDKIGHIKGKEPFVTKRLRKILRNAGYEVYLINEFNTSKLCHKCSTSLFSLSENKEVEIFDLSVSFSLCEKKQESYQI